MHIQSRSQVTRGRGEASPVLFESWKWCPEHEKKSPDCFNLLVKFSIQNVVRRVSGRKIGKIFSCGTSFCCIFGMFSCAFDMFLKCLLTCPSLTIPPPVLSPTPYPEKFHFPFCKTLHLKFLTVFWIRLCFDNCSVICTVTLCYIKQQTHSEFWYIQYFFFRYMPAY